MSFNLARDFVSEVFAYDLGSWYSLSLKDFEILAYFETSFSAEAFLDTDVSVELTN